MQPRSTYSYASSSRSSSSSSSVERRRRAIQCVTCTALWTEQASLWCKMNTVYDVPSIYAHCGVIRKAKRNNFKARRKRTCLSQSYDLPGYEDTSSLSVLKMQFGSRNVTTSRYPNRRYHSVQGQGYEKWTRLTRCGKSHSRGDTAVCSRADQPRNTKYIFSFVFTLLSLA